MQDQDQMLKLRVRKVLWSQGYHCPLEVDLSHFDVEESGRALRRSSLTDIDVLGIRFDRDLRMSTIVADCKSGREPEPSRIFWLRGVMDLFGAREGILVKTRVRSHARALAPKLDIRVLDEDGLAVLAQALDLDSLLLGVDDPNIHRRTIDLWGIDVRRGQRPTDQQLAIKKVYQHLQYVYWVTEEYRNVQTIIERFAAIGGELLVGDLRSKYLVHVGLQRLALSVLRMANAIAARDLTEIRMHARLYLFGGPLLLHERTEMIRLLEEFRQQNNLEGPSIELLPPYFDELVEVVNRIILNSQHAVRILQHLDGVLIECVLGQGRGLQEVLGSVYNTDSLVLAKRVASLFQQHAGFDRALLEELWPL